MTGIEITLLALIVILLLLLSGFFSGSETALTAISRARIHALEKEGNRRASFVRRLRDDKERLIGTILLGNNLVNITASALATTLAIQLFGFEGVAAATLILTILVIIFAEVLPKTFAIQHTERAALFVSPVFLFLVKISYPITTLVYAMVRVIFRLFGVREAQSYVSAREAIRGMIDLHHQEGEMERIDRDMLGSVLDLAEVQVAEVMVHRTDMVRIDAAMPPAQIIARVMDSIHTRLPLYRENEDNIVGIIHAKDVLRAIRKPGVKINDIDILSIAMEPWFIPETTTLLDQLHAFRRRRFHFALVVDEYGVLQGLITLEDILEEIVGQIDDEHDRQAMGVRKLADGSILSRGTTTIRDLNRMFDWNLPDEHAATIAGLVIHEARIIPEVGEQFIFHDFSFEITQKDRNQVTMLKIRPVPDSAL